MLSFPRILQQPMLPCVFLRRWRVKSPDYQILLSLLFDVVFSLLPDPPMIREAPQNMSVKAGGTAAFRCVATGDPTPHITWRQNGNKIVDNSRYIVTPFPGGSLLRIEPVRKKQDESVIECEAGNDVADPVTARSFLRVYSGDYQPLP